MSGYVLSHRARRDLQDIWQFTARRWTTEQADEYVAGIIAAIAQLANGQKPASSIQFDGQTYQRIFAGSHAIFCRTARSRQIRVIRILHQNMDIARHLK